MEKAIAEERDDRGVHWDRPDIRSELAVGSQRLHRAALMSTWESGSNNDHVLGISGSLHGDSNIVPWMFARPVVAWCLGSGYVRSGG